MPTPTTSNLSASMARATLPAVRQLIECSELTPPKKSATVWRATG